MKEAERERNLAAFTNGTARVIVTKPEIAGFGLNWQHCNHTVYFPTFSYEQYYQAIRRFWRFGQKNEVICDLVYSDGQKRVIDSLMAKSDKANELFSKLNSSINSQYTVIKQDFDKEIKLANFLTPRK
jgi:superfamily II DNA helicase RecQ